MINKNSILRNECFSSRKKNYKIKYFKQITFFSQLNWGLDKDSCKMQWKCVYLLVHYLLEGIKTKSVISSGRYMNFWIIIPKLWIQNSNTILNKIWISFRSCEVTTILFQRVSTVVGFQRLIGKDEQGRTQVTKFRILEFEILAKNFLTSTHLKSFA